MNKLKFLIGKGNTFYNYTNLLQKVTLSGRKGAAPRSLQVVLLDSEGYSMTRANIDVGNGQTCVLYDDGEEIFRGLLMTESKSSNRTVTLKAWDNCIYLCNSKNSFSYKKKTATQIFKDCCKKCNLTVGGAVSTGKKIGELTKSNSTYWDVIQDALSQTYSKTGKRFYVVSEKGKVYLRQRKDPTAMLELDVDTNTQSYEQTRSIYDTKTRIKLITSKNKTKKSYVNKDLEKKIGKFQETQSVDTDAKATELKQKIQTFKEDKSVVAQSLTWTGTGDKSVVSGGVVYAVIPALSLKRKMYVDEDTHTYEGSHHTMKLKLNYVPDYRTSSGSGSSSGKKTKYRVTASHLNMRSKPTKSSSVVTVMPHNATVTGTGKKSGNWIQITYSGYTGYAYASYLAKKK